MGNAIFSYCRHKNQNSGSMRFYATDSFSWFAKILNPSESHSFNTILDVNTVLNFIF